MTEPSPFDRRTPLPDASLAHKSKTLISFEARYNEVRSQLRLLIEADKLPGWNQKFHKGLLDIATLVQDQYPFVIFHGDVGTGKSAFAECIANRLVAESKVEDSILFHRLPPGRPHQHRPENVLATIWLRHDARVRKRAEICDVAQDHALATKML